MRRISARRLIEGGAAILAAHIRNHNIDMEGNRILIPLLRRRLRVFEVSYVILAAANKADLRSP